MKCPTCEQNQVLAVVKGEKSACFWVSGTWVWCPVIAYRCPCGQVFFVPAIRVNAEPFTEAMFV
jgi:hypothetical protein